MSKILRLNMEFAFKLTVFYFTGISKNLGACQRGAEVRKKFSASRLLRVHGISFSFCILRKVKRLMTTRHSREMVLHL
ncbi:hypothetical protein DQM68_10885 [Leptospira mayottensis]|uniref:Uncharacterized protein n=1 Tax=Leptospira mayottensis TaxID=1137606 RepID=A0ABN5NUM0_9LEPT|nr:hypothetical protein DQM68_10885 [Leptospira mayottensis]AXR65633.1 hypothetical protein DQM28_16840 [Leptospira mayottensis]AZQ02449.1 hypothetical protein LEP1GSC190_10810 [Leptospira mayottensis 200901116]TGM98446.1 hypothetical protein EHR03_14830 [Leptospira mayottensis]